MLENSNNPRVQKQYLRHCSVTIKNFNKEVKTVIGNDFEIEFEYFKTVDQTQEDDSGKVTIYGLSDETIALLEEEGGEIWLDCGYVYAQIDTLFIAHISRVYTEVSNNITATTIECSANLLTHFFSGYAVSDELTPLPLYNLLENLATSIGFPQMIFVLDNVPKEHAQDVLKFVSTAKTTSYNIGNINTVMDSVTDYYGLSFGRMLAYGKDSATFSFTDIGLKRVLKAIQTGYPSINTSGPETVAGMNIFFGSLSEDEAMREGFIFTKDTGLISQQAEYQLVTAFLDQQLGRNERETAESLYKRNNPREEEKPEAEGDDTFGSVETSPPLSSLEDKLVSNNDLSGLRIKPDKVKGTNLVEATAGGLVMSATVAFAYWVQSTVGSDLIRFTAFNDRYHKVNSPASLHTKGKAFDFTIRSGKSGAPRVAENVRRLGAEKGFKIRVDDEYNFPSSKATAGHIHVEVLGRGNAEMPTYPSNTEMPSKKEKSPIEQSQEELYGRVPVEINRRYNRIVALLNPTVKPQSLIFTEDKFSKKLLAHRVRNAKFMGNNKRGDWLMTLYCEDTESTDVSGYKVSSTPTSRELAPLME